MARKSTQKLLLLAVLICSLASSAVAKITIQVNLGGDLGVADGTVGVLVVDRSGNGFQSPDHVSVEGTTLSRGSQVGLSDDIIIGVVQSSGAAFSGGSGFAGTIRGIDYEALQLEANMPIAFYWFPGVTTPGASLNSSNFDTFRTADAATINRPGGSGTLASVLSWQLPGPRGLFNLVYLDAGNGGATSIGTGSDHNSGTTGTDDSVTPGGGGSTVDEATDQGGNQTLVDVNWDEFARGNYQGLITRGGGTRVDGEIFVTISPGGRFTSRVIIDGVQHVAVGQLNAAGDFGPVVISRTGLPPVSLTLGLRQDSNSNVFTLVGQVDNDGVLSNVEATQNAYQRDRTFVNEAGYYTFALPAPGGLAQTALPSGDGIGTLRVSPTGSFVALMTLGDGTTAVDTGFLSEDGILHMFTALYGNRGFLAGRVVFRNLHNVADLDGQLHWVKPETAVPTPVTTYAAGFETSVNLVGSKYLRPRLNTPMLWQFADTDNNVSLDLLGGALDPAFTQKMLTWSESNRITFPNAQAGEAVTIAAISATGSVRGLYRRTYVDGGGITRTQLVNFTGIALQKQGVVTGNFRGNDGLTGLLKIESTGQPDILVKNAAGTEIPNAGTVDFGNIGIDGGIGERVIEIENAGQGVLYLNSTPTVDDPNFGVAAGRWGYIQPGEMARLRVRFNPSATQAYAGVLTILSNDRTSNPYTINLIGTGVAGSDSSVDAGSGTGHGDTPGSYANPSDFSNNPRFDADPTGATGPYGGRVWNSDVLGATAGEASFRITGNANSGTGTFSGLLRIGTSTGVVTGSIDEDGTVTVRTFAGLLPRDYNLTSLDFVSNGDGDFGLLGTLTNIEDGSVINILAVHQDYNNTDNRTPWAGLYTMVIPANEDLGTGYPTGDSVATVRVNNDGLIVALFSLADGQVRSVTSRLTNEDRWNLYSSWTRGQLGGQVVFRDVPNVSDFDGPVRWTRPASATAQRFHEGFAMELTGLGSRFASPSRGQRLISQLPDGANNAQTMLEGFDPAVGNRDTTWSDANRLTVTPGNATERINIVPIAATGSVIGTFGDRYDDNGTTRSRIGLLRGVVFQKQGMVAGNWWNTSSAGYFGIRPVGQPTIEVVDASAAAIANGGTLAFGSIGVDGGI
ncbi:MAG: hypothetical protein AAF585_02215, partial [Verrucomicrobiota bacterium]